METFSRCELEKLEIGVTRKLNIHLMDVSVAAEIIAHDLVCQVRGFVWAQKVPEHEVKYPCDWWEGVKERWFTSWMKKRWPVKYTIFVYDAKILYPDLKYVSDNYFFHLDMCGPLDIERCCK